MYKVFLCFIYFDCLVVERSIQIKIREVLVLANAALFTIMITHDS